MIRTIRAMHCMFRVLGLWAKSLWSCCSHRELIGSMQKANRTRQKVTALLSQLAEIEIRTLVSGTTQSVIP